MVVARLMARPLVVFKSPNRLAHAEARSQEMWAMFVAAIQIAAKDESALGPLADPGHRVIEPLPRIPGRSPEFVECLQQLHRCFPVQLVACVPALVQALEIGWKLQAVLH
jgi:hypothetical protein